MKPLPSLFDLSGRSALVTGGSRGLGLEIAEGLAEAGAAVTLLARRSEWLDSAVAQLRTHGFRAEGLLCDVSDESAVKQAVETTLANSGQIDILVNNAGVTWGAPAEVMPPEKFRWVVEVNLTGAFLFCQQVGRHMLARGSGAIINIASINGVHGGLLLRETHISGYAASKAGLIGLTRELAARWGPRGIRVNAIAPGYFPTRMTGKIWEAAERKMRQDAPLGRPGAGGEIKGVAVFLAAPASSYMTGQTLIVDGGATLV